MNDSENSNVFGDWLLEQIKLRGWTKAEFSRISQVDDGLVSRHVLGTRLPGSTIIPRYAAALNVSHSEIRKHFPKNILSTPTKLRIRSRHLWQFLTDKEKQLVNKIMEEMIEEREGF